MNLCRIYIILYLRYISRPKCLINSRIWNLSGRFGVIILFFGLLCLLSVVAIFPSFQGDNRLVLVTKRATLLGLYAVFAALSYSLQLKVEGSSYGIFWCFGLFWPFYNFCLLRQNFDYWTLFCTKYAVYIWWSNPAFRFHLVGFCFWI